MAPPVAEPRRDDPSPDGQHGLTRADMVPILGTPSRVSEVLRGKKGLSMAMVQRLPPASVSRLTCYSPPPKKPASARTTKRAAA